MKHFLSIFVFVLLLNMYTLNPYANEPDASENQLPFEVGTALSFCNKAAAENIYYYIPSANSNDDGTLTLIKETYSSSIKNDDSYYYIPAEDSDSDKDSLTIIKETYK